MLLLIEHYLEELRQHNLQIDDNDKALDYLLTTNYSVFRYGYAKYFINPESGKFIDGTRFEEIQAVQIFDNDIRECFLHAIFQAERHLSAIIAHVLLDEYGDQLAFYMKDVIYHPKVSKGTLRSLNKIYIDIVRHFNKNKQLNNERLSFLDLAPDHFEVIVDRLTLGQLLQVYNALKPDLKDKIIKCTYTFLKTNIEINQPLFEHQFSSFLDLLKSIRNICAHSNRLLGYKHQRHIKYYEPLLKPQGISSDAPRNTAYHAFLVLQGLISETKYKELKRSIFKRMKVLDKRLLSIPLEKIINDLGFPDKWYSQQYE